LLRRARVAGPGRMSPRSLTFILNHDTLVSYIIFIGRTHNDFLTASVATLFGMPKVGARIPRNAEMYNYSRRTMQMFLLIKCFATFSVQYTLATDAIYFKNRQTLQSVSNTSSKSDEVWDPVYLPPSVATSMPLINYSVAVATRLSRRT